MIKEYEICMKNGIRRELLPLVKLRGIGRVRARRLFNNNITSPASLGTAGIENVTKILGRGIARTDSLHNWINPGMCCQMRGKRRLFADSQHCQNSDDQMTGKKETAGLGWVNKERYDPAACTQHTLDGTSYDIRAAIGTIEDRAAFLQNIRTIAEKYDTHIICFNADMLAGIRHAHSAICHAVRSYNEETMVSNTLEMEALLYAAGSRQCSLAALFGIHPGENHLYVCCYPACDGIWDALTPAIHIVEDSWSSIDPQKQAYLMDLFGITPDELATTSVDSSIIDLVLERIAMLEVYR